MTMNDRQAARPAGHRDDAMSILLRKLVVIALRVLLAIIFGIIALFMPDACAARILPAVYCYMLVDGV